MSCSGKWQVASGKCLRPLNDAEEIAIRIFQNHEVFARPK